ncbi:hypothetical protein Tco_1564720 [Tanacetum coccineum]
MVTPTSSCSLMLSVGSTSGSYLHDQEKAENCVSVLPGSFTPPESTGLGNLYGVKGSKQVKTPQLIKSYDWRKLPSGLLYGYIIK